MERKFVERELSNIERYYLFEASLGNCVCFVFDLFRGPSLPKEVFLQIFEVAQERFPILQYFARREEDGTHRWISRSTLESEQNRSWFQFTEKKFEGIASTRLSSTLSVTDLPLFKEAIQFIEAELPNGYHLWESPYYRYFLFRQQTENPNEELYLLTCTNSHVAMDGKSEIMFVKHYLEGLNSYVNGQYSQFEQRIKNERNPFPPSPEDIARKVLANSEKYSIHPQRVGLPPLKHHNPYVLSKTQYPQMRCRIIPYTAPFLIDDLSEKCRREGVTVHIGIVTAILLSYIQTGLFSPPDDESSCAFYTPIDYRRYDPSLKNIHSLLIGGFITTLHLNKLKGSFWDIARHVFQQFSLNVNGDKHLHDSLINSETGGITDFVQRLLNTYGPRYHEISGRLAPFNLSNMGDNQLNKSPNLPFQMIGKWGAISLPIMGSNIFLSARTIDKQLLMTACFISPLLSEERVRDFVKTMFQIIQTNMKDNNTTNTNTTNTNTTNNNNLSSSTSTLQFKSKL